MLAAPEIRRKARKRDQAPTPPADQSAVLRLGITNPNSYIDREDGRTAACSARQSRSGIWRPALTIAICRSLPNSGAPR